MYKIGSIVDAESAEYELKHPITGAPLGVVFTLAGPGHERRVALHAARTERAQEVFRRTGQIEMHSFTEQGAQRIETVTAAVLGWRGADRDFSYDAAREWFNDPRESWVVKQLAEAVADQARFIKDSAIG